MTNEHDDLESAPDSALSADERTELAYLWSLEGGPMTRRQKHRRDKLERGAREGRELPAELQHRVARRLHLETLATRNSNRLDFHELHVATLVDVLWMAFEAGRRARR